MRNFAQAKSWKFPRYVSEDSHRVGEGRRDQMTVLVLGVASVLGVVYKPSSLGLSFYTKTLIVGLELFGPSLPTACLETKTR